MKKNKWLEELCSAQAVGNLSETIHHLGERYSTDIGHVCVAYPYVEISFLLNWEEMAEDDWYWKVNREKVAARRRWQKAYDRQADYHKRKKQ